MKNLEKQFSEWSQGPKKQERKDIIFTHEEIRENIERKLKAFADYKANNCNVYLQGSYANHTNISEDSDVDIVVQYNNCFNPDISLLGEGERRAYKAFFNNECYKKFKEFKNDILSILREEYRDKITNSNKCLKLENHYKIRADIIPCFQHRRWKSFNLHKIEDYIEGIMFIDERTGKNIVNFPKIHKENCSKKNENTNQNFKPIIKTFKNIKKELVDLSKISKKLAPSYYIENLLYNVPDKYFNNEKSLEEKIKNIIIYLEDNLSEIKFYEEFQCANQIDSLFSQEKWNIEDALKFLEEIKLYIKEEMNKKY